MRHVYAEHPRKRLPASLEELLDEAVKEDAGFAEGDEDDAAMVDKLRSDTAAERYGLDIGPTVAMESA